MLEKRLVVAAVCELPAATYQGALTDLTHWCWCVLHAWHIHSRSAAGRCSGGFRHACSTASVMQRRAPSLRRDSCSDACRRDTLLPLAAPVKHESHLERCEWTGMGMEWHCCGRAEA